MRERTLLWPVVSHIVDSEDSRATQSKISINRMSETAGWRLIFGYELSSHHKDIFQVIQEYSSL
jgi:hypothetical protein